MDYLEQNGFGGGQYYAPGESADGGEQFQFGTHSETLNPNSTIQ